jgi:hypothetical protein
MKDILIIVSTWNRRDLTGITLDSLKRNKSAASDVLIIDDKSEKYGVDFLSRWDWPVQQHVEHVGVGMAAYNRYKAFLSSPEQYRYLLAMDNDLLLGAQFDYRLRQLWEVTKDPHRRTVLTGYRSVTQKVYEEHEDWVVVDGVGGAIQFVDRATAQCVFDEMPVSWWVHNWDHCISKVFERKIATKHSLAQHIGIYGSGVNGISEDVAYNFVGEGQW